MNRRGLLLALCLLGGCAASPAELYDTGTREAERLRVVHHSWLAERPRKIDLMDVPAKGLSDEARRVGFLEASVSGDSVLLITAKTASSALGLLFATVEGRQQSKLAELGLSIKPTARPNIFEAQLQAPGSQQ